MNYHWHDQPKRKSELLVELKVIGDTVHVWKRGRKQCNITWSCNIIWYCRFEISVKYLHHETINVCMYKIMNIQCHKRYPPCILSPTHCFAHAHACNSHKFKPCTMGAYTSMNAEDAQYLATRLLARIAIYAFPKPLSPWWHVQ